MLATIAEMKRRLRMPSASDEQDAVLEVFLDAAEEQILALTGYALADTVNANVKTQDFNDVQLGAAFFLEFRPIVGDVVLEARSLASQTFSEILGEIRNRKTGRIVALASEGVPEYPPTGGTGGWYKWRQITWPVVRVTYRVDPIGSPTNPVPNALKAAAAEWAVSQYSRAGGGALSALTVGKVSETYTEDSMPPVVRAMIAPHVRDLVTITW